MLGGLRVEGAVVAVRREDLLAAVWLFKKIQRRRATVFIVFQSDQNCVRIFQNSVLIDQKFGNSKI